VGALKQRLQAYDQTAETASSTLTRKLSSIWTVNVGLTASHETIIQQSITHDYTLFAAPFGVLYDTTNLPTPLEDPTHGIRASVSLAPTLSSGHPNSTFLVTQASFATYLDLGGVFRTDPGRSVLALRVLGGIAFGASQFQECITDATVQQAEGGCSKGQRLVSVPAIPPDQRFYAGGSGTVRGYRYQAVGPDFPDGTPVGGVNMTALNAEFRQRFATSLGAVVFVDAGQVSQSQTPFDTLLHGARCSTSTGTTTACWAVGVGIGGRYYTPIGAIRLDFAVPTFRRSTDDRFEVYIGLGQAF
jgi:translocation and assembly module TamA